MFVSSMRSPERFCQDHEGSLGPLLAARASLRLLCRPENLAEDSSLVKKEGSLRGL